MAYEVEITETLSKTITVEANNRREAIEKVEAAYKACMIVLSSDDYVTTRFSAKKISGERKKIP